LVYIAFSGKLKKIWAVSPLFRFVMANGYKDKWVKTIGSLIASVTVDSMGRPNSIFERLAEGFFYVDILAGFLITLMLWEGIKRVTVWLDKKNGWFENPLERFLLQFLLGVFVPVLLSFIITLAYMRLLWDQDIFKTEWLYNEMYMVVFIILIINFIYFSWWIYLKHPENIINDPMPAHSPSVDEIEAEEKETFINVTKGGKKIVLSAFDIAHIYLSEGYTYIQKFDGEDFVSTLSLDDFFKGLRKDLFFRTNRQIIVQRKACTSYQTIENGKIEVELIPKIEKRVIVSQKRAREFRKWISGKG